MSGVTTDILFLEETLIDDMETAEQFDKKFLTFFHKSCRRQVT